MYSTTKSAPGPKLCFQVMLAHLLLGSTVTFHIDCSSGAEGRVRRGVSGEEGGSAGDRETNRRTDMSSQERTESEVAVHRARQSSKRQLWWPGQRSPSRYEQVQSGGPIRKRGLETVCGHTGGGLTPFPDHCRGCEWCSEGGQEKALLARVQTGEEMRPPLSL